MHIYSTNEPHSVGEPDLKDSPKLSEQENHEKRKFEIPVNLVRNDLSESFLAGLCLYDLINNKDWRDRVLLKQNFILIVSSSNLFNLDNLMFF